MTALELIAVLAAAMGIGAISSILGIGGGSLFVPLMVLGLGLDGRTAVGTSLFIILFTALSSTLAYAREHMIDYELALTLSLGTVPGSLIGAYTTRFISSSWLTIAFSVFLCLTAARMLIPPKAYREGSEGPRAQDTVRSLPDARWDRSIYRMQLKPGVAASFIAGFVSSLLGIGGGVVMVPAMNLLLGVPIHLSVAASMLIICFTSSSGVIVHWTLRQVSLYFGIVIAIGACIGAQIGAHTAYKIKPLMLKRLFGATLILISARMFLLGASNILR
ncbi:MAG: sulfite exporter TauE/SafE family protein [Candidatus Bathyarchaeia archaeon]|nr:sulfite exporter TauE/SafE family protein [Candidatus Bathyarchaeota archaeon]